MKTYFSRLGVLLFLLSGACGVQLPTLLAERLVITITTQVTNESCPGTADGSILAIPAGGSGTYFFNWSTGDQVAQVTGLTAGTYSVTVTDNQGGFATASATVSVNGPVPTALAGTDTFICGASILLAATTDPGNTGQWLNLNSTGTILNPAASQTLVSGMSAGENTFVWVVTNGQCTNTDTIDVRVSATIQIDAGEDTLLCATQLDLQGSPAGGGSGLWTHNGPALTIPNPALPQSTASGFVPGLVYTLVWTVTEGPCTASDSIRIEAQAPPTANFTFNGFGQSVTFSDMSSFASSWSWDFGDGGSSPLPSPTYTYAFPGSFVVCLAVLNDCGGDTLCREVTIGLVAAPSTAPASVALSPVPASAHVQLSLNAWPDPAVEVSLWNLSGQELKRAAFATQAGDLHATLDLAGIAPGVYTIQVVSEGKSEIRRLLVAP